MRPLAHQLLVFAAHVGFCGVRMDGLQTKSSIEIKTRQSGRMVTDAQVSFPENRLACIRRYQARSYCGEYKRSAKGFKPDHGCRRGQQLAGRMRQLPEQIGKVSQPVRKMTALRHIRHETALEVTIAELWQFLEECNP